MSFFLRPWGLSLFSLSIGIPGLLFVAVLLGMPVGTLLFSAFSAELFQNLLWDRFTQHILLFTYGQAMASALLSTTLGGALALLCVDNSFWGKDALLRYSLFPFALPSLLVVLMQAGTWGIHLLLGWNGILLVHIFFNAPLAFRTVSEALLRRDRNLECVALSLGATRLRCFLEVTLPYLLPSLGSAFALSFLFCSASFLPVLVFGGSPQFTSIEVAIYQSIKMNLQVDRAVHLGIWQLSVCLCVCFALFRKSHTRSAEPISFFPIYRVRTRLSAYALALASGVGLLVLYGIPLTKLVAEALWVVASRGLGLSAKALFSTWAIALLSATVGCVASVSLAYVRIHGLLPALSKGVDALALLPMLISSVLLSFSWLFLVPDCMYQWRGHWWPIIGVHSLLSIPIGYRLILNRWQEIPREIPESAQSLGAREYQIFWQIELPLLKKALGVAFLCGFSLSVGEVGAPLLFATEDLETLSLALFRSLSRYQFSDAKALCTLLLGLVVGTYALTERVQRRSSGPVT